MGISTNPPPLETPLGGKVIYPGSPQGLDVSETGHRRFLVLDTENFEVTERRITSGPLYLDWKFFVFPSDEEVDGLFNQLDQCLAAEAWEKEKQRVQLALRVEGFTKNKDLLVRSFQKGLVPWVSICMSLPVQRRGPTQTSTPYLVLWIRKETWLPERPLKKSIS